MILKNICSITSMQGMTEKFNNSKCAENVCRILDKDPRNFLPHYVTINECLERYACEPVFQICKENKWEYLIRYKDGSIPTVAEEYHSIVNMGESNEKIELDEIIYKRKAKEIRMYKMRWVDNINYQGRMLTVIELKIRIDEKESKAFQWITNMNVTEKNIKEFARTGRKRWKIED